MISVVECGVLFKGAWFFSGFVSFKLSLVPLSGASLASHTPIHISGNADFTASNGVTGGQELLQELRMTHM